jgi:O-methyltransferase
MAAMPWRARVNSALTSTTGYRVVRETTLKSLKAQARKADKLAEKADRLAQKLAAVPKPKARPEFPKDYDEMALPIMRAASPYSMTRKEKKYALYLATRYITDNKIPGAIVECGVWRGGSMHVVARTLDAIGDTSRELYLFDTFEGMTPPTEKDLTTRGVPVSQLLEAQPKTAQIWAYASLEDVKQGFEEVPYPKEKIHYVQGRVEDTLPEQAPDEIAILRLDTDWYESTRHELFTLYDRLVPGGVLIIDDYGSFQGAKQATDEFIAETGARLLLIPLGPGRVAVKP